MAVLDRLPARLRAPVQQARSVVETSLWLWPATGIVVGLLAAVVGLSLGSPQLPLLTAFSDVEAARATLTTVITATTAAMSLLFTGTIVALQLATGQYSPRLLRDVMLDNRLRSSLALLVGTVAYALTVVPQLGNGDVPSVAVAIGIVAGFAVLIAFVVFLDRIVDLLRLETILKDVTARGLAAVEEAHPLDHTPVSVDLPPHAVTVEARRSGYVQAVSLEALGDAAAAHGVNVMLRPSVGDFLVRDTAAAWVWRTEDDPDADDTGEDATDEDVSGADVSGADGGTESAGPSRDDAGSGAGERGVGDPARGPGTPVPLDRTTGIRRGPVAGPGPAHGASAGVGTAGPDLGAGRSGVARGPEPPDADTMAALADAVDGALALGTDRTVASDPAYALRHLVDIGLRGVSPGVNDPTTAQQAINHATELLVALARRPLADRVSSRDDVVAVVRQPDLAGYLEVAQSQLLAYGGSDPRVVEALVHQLRDVLTGGTAHDRVELVRIHLDRIEVDLRTRDLPLHSRAMTSAAIDQVEAILAGTATEAQDSAD